LTEAHYFLYSQPSEFPSVSLSPSISPVPGCSGISDGGNYCINPLVEDVTSHAQIRNDAYFTPNFSGSTFTAPNLGRCEGHCNADSMCQEGLVCFQRNDNEFVPGCTGTPRNGWHYCIYPQLSQETAYDSLDYEGGSFLRIGDSGVLTVFTADGSGIIWNSTLSDQSAVPFDHESDISLELANQLHFSTDTYTHSTIQFDFDSETTLGGFHVNTASSIEIFSTTSLAYKLVTSYSVSRQSRLSFDIHVGRQIKAIAICLDQQSDYGTDTIIVTSCMAIGGTAIEETFGTDIQILSTSAENDNMVSIDIAVKELFPSRSKFNIIGIMQVANLGTETDVNNITSLIENIDFHDISTEVGRRLLETGDTSPCDLLVYTIDSACPPGCMVETTKGGLFHELQDVNDFCISMDIALKQTAKNEEETCSLDENCRSGLCQDNQCISKVSSVVILLFLDFYNLQYLLIHLLRNHI